MKPKLKLVENIASSTAPQKIVIQKGVVIKKRERSDAWQIYITVKGKKPIRKSANTDNVEKAKQMALTLFAEKNYKVENNLPIQKHLFADVANKYIADLDRLVSNGAKKEATATFAKTTISNYFVPYFGKTSVEAINRVAIADFQKWRIENSVKFEDGVGRYIEFCKNSFSKSFNLKNFKLLIDCANGATYQIAPKIFFELGANVDLCNVSPDGKNINLNCGVLNPKLLIEKMKNSNYDYAIGFDGDGDRVIFIDKGGEVYNGDKLLYVLANFLNSSGKLKKAGVVGTQMTNLGIEEKFNGCSFQWLSFSPACSRSD